MSAQERRDGNTTVELYESRGGTPPTPGAWRRVLTGVAAALSSVLGLIMVVEALHEVAQADECRASDWSCGFWGLWVLPALYFFVTAATFGIATILPFGGFRRFVVAFGSGLIAVFAVFVGALLLDDTFPSEVPIFRVSFGAGCCAGYWLSR